MQHLSALYIREDEIALVFDDGAQQRIEEDPKETLSQILQHLLDRCETDEEREKFLNLSIREFCQICLTSSEAQMQSALGFNAPKMHVLTHLKDYTCPNCHKEATLQILDGHLRCGFCHEDLGDIDDLPDDL